MLYSLFNHDVFERQKIIEIAVDFAFIILSHHNNPDTQTYLEGIRNFIEWRFFSELDWNKFSE